MAFEARVYIQGVGIYRPDRKTGEMLVLFPDQEEAFRRGFLTPGSPGADACRHYAVAQFYGQDLHSELGPLWTTIDLEGHWVSFDARPAPPATSLPGPLLRKGRVPGVPSLARTLQLAQLKPSKVDPNVLPKKSEVGKRLVAGLHIDSGKASPASDFTTSLSFHNYQSKKSQQLGKAQIYSSVLKVEYGLVESFALRLKLFGSQRAERTISFQPIHDELEIWIRHYCELTPPIRDAADAKPGVPLPWPKDEMDHDFLLNYSLLDDAQRLAASPDRLPRPKISRSWLQGSPVGGSASKCMAGQDP